MKKAITQQDIMAVLEVYPKEKRFSLAIMQDLQRRLGYVPRVGLELLAAYLDVKVSALYAMATFYKALSLTPKGEHVIKVCDGTACHIRGAPVLLDALERALHVKPGETTADGLFTVETVNCLGACAIAPVMVVDERYFSKVCPEQIDTILAEIAAGGKEDVA